MFLQKVGRINYFISIWLERISIVALLVMLAATCVDVVGTKFFGSPLLGTIDIVTLSQVNAIAFTIAIAQITGRHIRVELFFSMLPKTSQAYIDVLVYLFQSLFFAVVVWRLYMLGRALQIAAEVSAMLFVPLYPFIFAIAIGFIPICMICLLNFINAPIKAVRK